MGTDFWLFYLTYKAVKLNHAEANPSNLEPSIQFRGFWVSQMSSGCRREVRQMEKSVADLVGG